MKDKKRIKYLLIDDSAEFYDVEPIFGDHIRIDRGFHCTANIELGDYIHISPYVVIIGGNNSQFKAMGFNNIMTGSKIICASDRFAGFGIPGSMIPEKLKGRVINEPIIMEMFSNLGAGAVLMPGSRLRKGTLLTVNSVLFGDTVEWGVYKGNPATLDHVIDGHIILENAKKLGYEGC